MDPSDFVSSQSILTLGAAAIAVAAIANSLRRVFDVPALKTAFFASLAIAILRVAISDPQHWVEWPLSFVNGCILFCTSTGMNEWTVAVRPRVKKKGLAPSTETDAESHQRPFFGSWVR